LDIESKKQKLIQEADEIALRNQERKHRMEMDERQLKLQEEQLDLFRKLFNTLNKN
jgi:hypothetical protein